MSLPGPRSTSPHAASAAAALASLDALLEADAPALRDGLPATFGDATARFVELLLEANDGLNLTRVVEPTAIARLHLLDALSGLPALDGRAPAAALDLGSGGGVPGIVLAIARPEIRWTLVDSVRKKAAVLDTMVRELGLANVEVVAERAEVLGRDGAWRESADLVTARACASLPVLAEYALPLLRLGGSLLAWKGRIGTDELEAGARAAAQLGGAAPQQRGTRIASLDDHCFVLVEKVSPTSARFPRRPGEPSRRPLG